MDKEEFKDCLFDILNETDELPIQDIVAENSKDRLNIYLTDGTRFTICVEYEGIWSIQMI